MTNKLTVAALAAMLIVPLEAAPVLAQSSNYDRDYARHDHYNDGHVYRDNDRHVYRGNDRYYRHKCGGGNGAVGTIAGGAGGAVLGSALGGGTLGTVAGGLGGALLGRHLDKKHTEAKNDC